MTKVMAQSSPEPRKGKRKKSSLKQSRNMAQRKSKWKPQIWMGKIQEMDSNWVCSQAWEATKKILDEV